MVDLQERKHRIFEFMARDSKVASLRSSIWRWKDMVYINKKAYKPYLNELRDKLIKAKKRRHELTDTIFYQMKEGIINDSTKGIWFSYKKGIYRLPDLPDKTRLYIYHLETGENLLVAREKYLDGTYKKPQILKVLNT